MFFSLLIFVLKAVASVVKMKTDLLNNDFVDRPRNNAPFEGIEIDSFLTHTILDKLHLVSNTDIQISHIFRIIIRIISFLESSRKQF